MEGKFKIQPSLQIGENINANEREKMKKNLKIASSKKKMEKW